MLVKINPRKISPDLRQKIEDYTGQQQISEYPSLRVDTSRVSFLLMQALEDASKVRDSGVVAELPAAKPEAKSEEPCVLDEGGQRLRYHVKICGLLNTENNILAIKDWFRRHPEEKFDAATVDRVVFKEIEEELLWEPGNKNHEFWVARFNPPPPKAAPPPPKPPKVESEKKRRERIWQEYMGKSGVNI